MNRRGTGRLMLMKWRDAALWTLVLREMRRRAGLSQKIVAQRSGVNAKTLSAHETSRRISSIKLVHFLAIVRACGYTLTELIALATEIRADISANGEEAIRRRAA